MTNSTSNTSKFKKDRHHHLIKKIECKFKFMAPIIASKCCIYKVPNSLRKINEAAYTPRVISIGPFHHNKHDLKSMEKYKARYLHDFLQKSEVTMDVLVNSIKDLEEIVRQCYAESIELGSDKFVEMLLLDGIFIIEYFRSFYMTSWGNDENYKFIYTSKLGADTRHDLILLENQLPFSFLDALHKLAYPCSIEDVSFLTISISFFSYFNKQDKTLQGEVLHFTDMIRTFYLPSKPRLKPTRSEADIEKIAYSAMELHKAGVAFVASSSKCLFDIKFTPDGVLEIPHFNLEDRTEALFRNLMAFEQYHYQGRIHLCNYIALMDKLIDTEKDVELLVRKGILSHLLGGHDVPANVINSLDVEIIHYDDEPYFSKLYEDLDKYYKYPWHSWKAALRRDYFSTPWKIASVVAATILLVLTLLQTINSFLSL